MHVEADSEFVFEAKRNGCRFVFPNSWYPGNTLPAALATFSASFRYDLDVVDSGRSILAIECPASDWDFRVARAFAAINGLPALDAGLARGFRNASRPLVSCIILLTANDLFVRRTLIPSIIASSPGIPLEIIVVYNGHGCDLEQFRGWRVTRSRFGSVPRGYNKGVSKARGEYVAIFHDDCVLDDDHWVEKAVARLTADSQAVTPEFQVVAPSGVRIAKNVPLVMVRRTFNRTGGYDTKYYAGLEDLDFTYALLAAGYRVDLLDARVHHFDGMSTTIMLHPRARELKQLYGLNMVPKAGVAEIKRRLFERAGFEINLVTAKNMARFARKFASYLSEHGHHDFLDRAQRYSELAHLHQRHPLIKREAGLIGLYRSRLNW
ncbi:MAG: glycosyltransferase [Vicinamibacterales bacterium]